MQFQQELTVNRLIFIYLNQYLRDILITRHMDKADINNSMSIIV